MSEILSTALDGRRLIRRAELQRLVPFSMVHIWRLERESRFPRRVLIGPNAVAWYADEVAAWIEGRVRAGGRAPQRRGAADAAA
jgi:prophage regulatory protein